MTLLRAIAQNAGWGCVTASGGCERQRTPQSGQSPGGGVGGSGGVRLRERGIGPA